MKSNSRLSVIPNEKPAVVKQRCRAPTHKLSSFQAETLSTHALKAHLVLKLDMGSRLQPLPRFPLEILILILEHLQIYDWVRVLHAVPVLAQFLLPRHLSTIDQERNTIFHILADKGEDLLLGDLLLKTRKENPNPATRSGIDCGNYAGRTPLSLAAGRGHERVVKLLLRRDDVNVNSRDNYGLTSLSHAAIDGCERVVQLLINHHAIDVAPADYHRRQTPIFLASSNGHVRVVKALLASDSVDPNDVDSKGRTPLFYAAQNRHEEVIKLLTNGD